MISGAKDNCSVPVVVSTMYVEVSDATVVESFMVATVDISARLTGL